VLTSGGDRIFPKGLPVGRVTKVSPGSDLFLNIRVKPAISLSRLEEVLVVTKIDERQAESDRSATARAADILAERLPTVPPKPENAPGGSVAPSSPGSAAKPAADAKPKVPPPATTTNGSAPDARKAVTPASSSPGSTAKATTDAKPKVSPPATATNGTAPVARKAIIPAPSSANNVSKAAAGTSGVKTSPKPAKPATEPKPQPAVQDPPQ
jgi:rod shape-determining protein MreC